jgi:hypothetical protein
MAGIPFSGVSRRMRAVRSHQIGKAVVHAPTVKTRSAGEASVCGVKQRVRQTLDRHNER